MESITTGQLTIVDNGDLLNSMINRGLNIIGISQPGVCRFFLPWVHLVPRLLVPEKACGFSPYESDMPPVSGIREIFVQNSKGIVSQSSFGGLEKCLSV